MTEPVAAAAVQVQVIETDESDDETSDDKESDDENDEAAAELQAALESEIDLRRSRSESDVERENKASESLTEHILTMTDDDSSGEDEEELDDSSSVDEEELDDSSGEDAVAASGDEAVEHPALLAMVQLSMDSYISNSTGLRNSTIVVDPRLSEVNQKFLIEARKFIGVSKWNSRTMDYNVIHQLQVNHLLVGVTMRDNSKRLSFDAYGVPQKRLVVDFNNDMQALIAALNTHINPFAFQFQSNNDAPLLTLNFTRGSDNSNYLHGHTFYLDDFIMDELGSSVSYSGKRMYRLHPGIKLKHGASKFHQYLRNKGIKATEIKVKGPTLNPVF